MDRLSYLPTEILRHVFTYLTVHNLSCIRLASKKLAVLADHPSHWRHIQLLPPPSLEENDELSTSINLWKVTDLHRIIGPHRQMIESIQIWGVRDNIVRYIMSNCTNLTDLTVCGWVTLSDHAFKCFGPKIYRLILMGVPNQPNYTALDATTLASLLIRCPLTELVIKCLVHIHAPTLIYELSRQHSNTEPLLLTKSLDVKSQINKNTTSTCNKNRYISTGSHLRLQQLTLATRRTWSTEHVMAMFDICPSLNHVCLCPAATNSIQTNTSTDEDIIIHRSTEET